MQTRAFNYIDVDYKHRTFTKSSFNTKKLEDEIFYYLHLPQNVSNFFPQFINYYRDYSAYSLEYISAPTLEELLLHNKISIQEGKDILQQLFAILEIIHAHRAKDDSYQKVAHFYINKTVDRVNDLQQDAFFNTLLSQAKIKINGSYYKNFHSLENNFIRLIKKHARKNHTTRMIHGDFCFSNILYANNQIKLIDPRGSFTEQGIYGHILYDYAKLMHCLHSSYDYLVNDQFYFSEYDQRFYFSFPRPDILQELEDELIKELSKKTH